MGSVYVYSEIRSMSIEDDQDLSKFNPEPMYGFAEMNIASASGIILISTPRRYKKKVYFLHEDASYVYRLTDNVEDFFSGNWTYNPSILPDWARDD